MVCLSPYLYACSMCKNNLCIIHLYIKYERVKCSNLMFIKNVARDRLYKRVNKIYMIYFSFF